jgi:hypothetical protein
MNLFQLLYDISGVRNIFSITPSDVDNLEHPTTGLYVGTEGDVNITTIEGQTVTLKNLASGVWHPIRATKIASTGTTATDIMGAW